MQLAVVTRGSFTWVNVLVSLGKVVISRGNDYTSRKFTKVNFHGAEAENKKKKHPEENPM